jgi:hypothetical protein
MGRHIALIRVVVLAWFSLPLPRVAHSEEPPPSADAVVARMAAMDLQRRSEFQGYSAIVHYFALNKEKHAEMNVEVMCNQDGKRSFRVLDESGSHSIRKHVFSRMLREESDASKREARKTIALTPDNYNFRIAGHETVGGREMWVLEITPKVRSEYLIAGKIWIDQKDFALSKIEGIPGRDPSFWTRNVHIVRTYEKIGSFWLPASTHSESNVVFFGPAELTIFVSDYALSTPAREGSEDSGDPELAAR